MVRVSGGRADHRRNPDWPPADTLMTHDHRRTGSAPRSMSDDPEPGPSRPVRVPADASVDVAVDARRCRRPARHGPALGAEVRDRSRRRGRSCASVGDPGRLQAVPQVQPPRPGVAPRRSPGDRRRRRVPQPYRHRRHRRPRRRSRPGVVAARRGFAAAGSVPARCGEGRRRGGASRSPCASAERLVEKRPSRLPARANAELLGHDDSLAREHCDATRPSRPRQRHSAEVTTLRNEVTGLRREVDSCAAGRCGGRAHGTGRRRARRHPRAARRGRGDPRRDPRRTRRRAEGAACRRCRRGGHGWSVGPHRARALRQQPVRPRPRATPWRRRRTRSGRRRALPARLPERPVRSPRAPQRKPFAIPGGVYGDSLAAARHVCALSQDVVIVDGYDVAKLAWPALEPAMSGRCASACSKTSPARHGTEMMWCSTVPMSWCLLRSPVDPGCSTRPPDQRRRRDPCRGAGPSCSTPVVVVTNDQAIVTDVARRRRQRGFRRTCC